MKKITVNEVVDQINVTDGNVLFVIETLQQLVKLYDETIYLEIIDTCYSTDNYSVIKRRLETDAEFEKRSRIEQQRNERFQSSKLKTDVKTFLTNTIKFDPTDESAFEITRFQTDADKILPHHKNIYTGVTIKHIATDLVVTSQKSLDYKINIQECMRLLKELVTLKQLRKEGLI